MWGRGGGWRAPLLGLGNFSDSPCLHFLVTSRHPPKRGTQEIGGEPISSPIIRSLKDQFHTTDKKHYFAGFEHGKGPEPWRQVVSCWMTCKYRCIVRVKSLKLCLPAKSYIVKRNYNQNISSSNFQLQLHCSRESERGRRYNLPRQ